MERQIQTVARSRLLPRWFLLTASVFVSFILLSAVLLSFSSVAAEPLAPVANISGTVVQPDSSPIAQATWVCLNHLHPEGWPDWSECKDSEIDGSFAFTSPIPGEFLPGDFFVWADAPPGSPYFPSLGKGLYIVSDGDIIDVGPVTLTYASFAGMVYNPDMTPADQGKVTVDAFDGMESYHVAGAEYHLGNYAIGGVPDGDFMLVAHAPEDSILWGSQPESVSVAPGSQYLSGTTQYYTLTLQEPNLTGMVVYPNGSPVTWIMSGTDQRIGWAWVKALNPDIGEWVVDQRSTASWGEFGLGLPHGDYWLFAYPDGELWMTYTRAMPVFVNVPAVSDVGPMTLTYPSFSGMILAPDSSVITECLHVWVEDQATGELWPEQEYCGAEGPYRIGGVPAGDYWLLTDGLPERGLFPAYPVSVTVAPGSQYDLLATQFISLQLNAPQLEVFVEYPPGTPITANVNLWNDSRDVAIWEWAEPGRPALFGGFEPGETYWIEAWPDWVDVPMLANSVREQIVLTTTLISRTLVLQTPNFTGTVLRPEGAPLPQAYEGPDPIPHPASVHVHRTDGTFDIGTTANPAGEFSLALPDGDYVIEAHPFANLAFTYTKSLPQGFALPGTAMLPFDINLTYPSVRGHVLDPADNPIPGCVSVWLEDISREWLAADWYCGGQEWPYRLGGVEPGDYWLMTDGLPEFGLFPAPPVRVHIAPGSQYDPDGTQVIDRWLTEEAFISGYVRDCDADPEVRIPGAFVVAHDAHWNIERGTETDENGEFSIGGVISGTPYIVETFPPPESAYVPLEPIEVVPPATGVVLEMCIPPTNVVGLVHDYTGAPVPGAGAVIFSDDFWDETRADELGGFRFRGVATGTYWVQAAPPWGVEGLLASDPVPVSIDYPTHTVDVGVLTLPKAFKMVTGHVVFEGTTDGVPDAMVWAHRLDKAGYADAPTGLDGAYALSLSGGEWLLGVEPLTWPVTWIFPGPPAWVPFVLPLTETEVISSVELEVIRTNAWVRGRIVCPDGQPCDGTPPYEDIWPEDIWVELRNDDVSNGTHPDPNYEFIIPVPDGWYELVVHLGAHWLQGPEPRPVFVGPGGTRNVGDIPLLLKDSFILGRVTNQFDNGVANIPVVAWRPEGFGWGWAETGARGYYTMPVVSGEWFVEPRPRSAQPYVFNQQAKLARVAPRGTMAGVNFGIVRINALIKGAAVDADSGHRIWGLDGWAWTERADTGAFFSDAPMWDGGFTLKVGGGYTYHVGLHVPPDAPYASGGRANVPVGPGELVTVAVPLEHKDAVIEGQLIDALTGLPPTRRVWAGVFGEDENGNWTDVRVDPDTAGYEMRVVSGTWHLRAWVDPQSGYVAAPVPVTVTIQSGGLVAQDFEVWPIGATIAGTVLQPDGTTPMSKTFVFAEGESPFVGRFEARVKTDESGRFELLVPEGGYIVGAGLPGDELEMRHWLNPPPVDVPWVSAGSPVTGLQLRFRELDGLITGTVAFSTTAVVTASHPAYIWGWSEGGEWAETEAPVVSGTNTFTYSMRVVSGTTWHIGAVYEDWDHGVYYKSRPEEVVPVLPPSGRATQYLTMTGPYALPQPFIVSFDGAQMQTIVMPDGVELRIPPGALVVSGTVTLFIFPTQALRPEKDWEIIGPGYEIWAIDQNGQEITKFNKNVVMTFHYPPDAALQAQGISEQLLIPVYYSTLVGRWILMDSYVVDTVHNEIRLQLSHFSRMGIRGTAPGEAEVYLPLVLRNFGS